MIFWGGEFFSSFFFIRQPYDSPRIVVDASGIIVMGRGGMGGIFFLLRISTAAVFF